MTTDDSTAIDELQDGSDQPVLIEEFASIVREAMGRPVYSIDTPLITASRPICPFMIHYLSLIL